MNNGLKNTAKIITILCISALIYFINQKLALVPLTVKPDFNVSDLFNYLGFLIFVSLVLEKSLDVFLTIFLAENADLEKQEIRRLKSKSEKLTDSAQPEYQQIMLELNKAIKTRIASRSKTRKIALYSGLAFGIIISALGVRALDQIFDLHADSVTTIQHDLFATIDILATGMLLAGGSEGLHKLTELYRTFMDKSNR